MTENINNTQTILDAGKALAGKVETIAGIPCLVTPTGAAPLVSIIDLADKRANKPRRRTGTANMQALDSFVEYVNRFKSAASTVRADASKRVLVGILNDNPAGAESDAAWGDHRVVYACPVSTEWQTWGNGRENVMGQDAFATFLLKNERDIAVGAGRSACQPYPQPSDLMTLAHSLESFSSMNNKRTRDPRTGQMKVQFSEESGIKGEIAIPPAFGIDIPIFEDADPVLVEVGLRVEVKDGSAVFVFGVNDPAKVLRAAFASIVERVKADTALPVFVGTDAQ